MIEVADVRLDGSRQSKEYTEVQAVNLQTKTKTINDDDHGDCNGVGDSDDDAGLM